MRIEIGNFHIKKQTVGAVGARASRPLLERQSANNPLYETSRANNFLRRLRDVCGQDAHAPKE